MVRSGRVCQEFVWSVYTGDRAPSPYSEIVDAFQRCAALPADHRVAVAAHQRISHRLRARRAIQFLLHNYFAAAIDSTVIVLVFSSSVPVTVTFLAANFSGVF